MAAASAARTIAAEAESPRAQHAPCPSARGSAHRSGVACVASPAMRRASPACAGRASSQGAPDAGEPAPPVHEANGIRTSAR
eukprot:scaffold3607_cov114-Isochrysis_galbana.AAC.27